MRVTHVFPRTIETQTPIGDGMTEAQVWADIRETTFEGTVLIPELHYYDQASVLAKLRKGSYSPDGVKLMTNPLEAQVPSYMKTCNLSEADARRVLGLPPKEVASMGRYAVAEFEVHRAAGLSESKAIEIVKQLLID